MFGEILAFAALPLAAAIVFTGIHTWFGLQVLRRNVVFADLALAQVSALGATVAVVAGHAVSSTAGYAYALIFTAAGALLLTASRGIARNVRQEAFIGVLYVVATAATVLVVDRSPQGAEHVKRMLVGSILSVSADEVMKFTVLYGLIGALHWVVRRQLLRAADDTSSGAGATAFWDLVFYLSFGVVVTSSVGTAGVLLVFCFLIVPALIGSLFSPHIGAALAIGWAARAAERAQPQPANRGARGRARREPAGRALRRLDRRVSCRRQPALGGSRSGNGTRIFHAAAGTRGLSRSRHGRASSPGGCRPALRSRARNPLAGRRAHSRPGSPHRVDATNPDRNGSRRTICHGSPAHTRARARALVSGRAARRPRLHRNRGHRMAVAPRRGDSRRVGRRAC